MTTSSTHKVTSRSLDHCSWKASFRVARGLRENEVEWSEKAEIRQAEFLAVGKWASNFVPQVNGKHLANIITGCSHGRKRVKRENFDSSGLSVEGTLLFHVLCLSKTHHCLTASLLTVPHLFSQKLTKLFQNLYFVSQNLTKLFRCLHNSLNYFSMLSVSEKVIKFFLYLISQKLTKLFQYAVSQKLTKLCTWSLRNLPNTFRILSLRNSLYSFCLLSLKKLTKLFPHPASQKLTKLFQFVVPQKLTKLFLYLVSKKPHLLGLPMN